MDIWLLDIDAPNNLFVAIGKFNYGVSISYIAAFVFYLITVHYPDTKSAIAVYTAASFPAKAIVSNIEYIFIDMAKKLGFEIKSEHLNEETITDILAKTKCYSDSTLTRASSITTGIQAFENWLEYLRCKDSTIKQLYKNLYPLYSKLDGEYVKALSLVEQDGALFQVSAAVPISNVIKNGDATTMCFDNGLEKMFIELYGKARDLKKIINCRSKTYHFSD